MTLDTATTSPPTETSAPTANAAVIDKIRQHHTELAGQLDQHTRDVATAAENGDCTAPRAALHQWYRDELMPHIVAEEQALYSAAEELETTKLLVCGMLAEHRALVSLVADLGLARQAFETAAIARSAHVLFTVHLTKENDLLLPALDAAGLDLAELLAGMHHLLDANSEAHGSEGCGCGDANERPAPRPVHISTEPPRPQPDVPHVSDRGADLDVRTLPHGQRHEIIFGRLNALTPGRRLVIVNDHDPKPLRYQTEALWPDRFTWTYEEAGPQVWRVAITRAD